MVGKLISSKAGHDKDEIYMIIKEEKNFVFVVDGIRKKIDLPKRKNKKHIQIINQEIDVELVNKLQNNIPVRDEEIKRVIKLYKNPDK